MKPIVKKKQLAAFGVPDVPILFFPVSVFLSAAYF
jgi:hypothetical protein